MTKGREEGEYEEEKKRGGRERKKEGGKEVKNFLLKPL